MKDHVVMIQLYFFSLTLFSKMIFFLLGYLVFFSAKLKFFVKHQLVVMVTRVTS